MVVANGMRRRAGDCVAYLVEGCWQVGDVAVREWFEAEVENAVKLVEGNAHVETGFGGGKAIAAGLLFQLHLYDDTLIAFLGFDSLKFTKPTKIGDTVHVKLKVLEKRETSNADRGVMKRQLQVINQRGEVVQDAVQAFLLKRKPKV